MAKFSEEQRRALAAKGIARPDGSYPIRNAQDLRNAAKDYYRTGRNPAVGRWIMKRARDLGMSNPIDGTDKYKAAISMQQTHHTRL